jgi:hypothetical protein
MRCVFAHAATQLSGAHSQTNPLVSHAAVDRLVELSSTAIVESALGDAKHVQNPFRATLDPLRAGALFLSYTRKRATWHIMGALPKLPNVGVLDVSVTDTLESSDDDGTAPPKAPAPSPAAAVERAVAAPAPAPAAKKRPYTKHDKARGRMWCPGAKKAEKPAAKKPAAKKTRKPRKASGGGAAGQPRFTKETFTRRRGRGRLVRGGVRGGGRRWRRWWQQVRWSD